MSLSIARKSSSGAADAPLQAETTTLDAAGTSPLSSGVKTAVNNLIYKFKLYGAWDRCDRIYAPCLTNSQIDTLSGRLDWKNPGTDTLTASGGLTWAKQRGVKGDAATGKLLGATNFNAFTKYTQNDAHLSVWVTDAANNIDYVVGGENSGGTSILAQSGASSFQIALQGTSITATQPKNFSSGWIMASRKDSANISGWMDGVQTGTGASTSGAPLAAPLSIMKNAGTFAKTEVSFVTVGANIEWMAPQIYAALQEFMTAMGVLNSHAGEYAFDFMSNPSIKSPEGYVIPVRVCGPQYVRDWENVYFQTQNLEVPFSGYRRVRNLLSATAVLATQTVTVASGTHVMSFTGTGSVAFSGAVSGSPAALVGQSATARVSKQITTTAGSLTVTITGDVRMGQLEDVTYQTNKNPGEYVSSGTLVIPYHGPNVDGVKYFTTQNGNTVASELVTEVTGAALTPYTVIRGLDAWTGSKNLLLQSEDLGTTWVAVGTPTRTPAAKTCGRDIKLDLIGDDDGAVLEGYTQVPAAFTDQPSIELNRKAPSVFVQQGTSVSSAFRLRDTTAAADRWLGVLTWSGGLPVVTMTTGTYADYELVLCNDGTTAFRLLFLSATVIPANAHSFEVYPATDSALATTSTGTLYCGGLMLADYAAASPHIPTTTAVVTRADQKFNDYRYGGLPWVNHHQGTFIVDATLIRSMGHAYFYELHHQDNTGNNRIFNNIYTEEVPQNIASQCFAAGAQQSSLAHRAWADGARHKIAYGYKTNSLKDCMDGGAVATDSVATMPPGMDGAMFFTGNASGVRSNANSYIHKFKYKQTLLADASLQSETA